MRRFVISIGVAVLSVAFAATAQAQYGQQPPPPGGYGAPAGTEAFPEAQPAPQPEPQPAPPPAMYAPAPAPAPMAAPADEPGMKPMSGFIGPRLNIEFSNQTSDFGTMIVPEIEGGIWIMNVAQVFLGFGTAVYGQGVKVADVDDPVKARYGNLMFHLGGRFNLTKPKPGGAYLYLGVDFIFVAGLAKSEAGGEEDEEAEDSAKEAIDRFGFGPLIGVEYLFSRNFGVGIDTGLRLFINNLKDMNPDTDYDYCREAYLEVPFSLRFMYHF